MNTKIPTMEEQLCALLVRYLEPRWTAEPRSRIKVDGATNLTSDLTLDSFQVMEFLMEIEDALDVAIDMNSLSEVHTVSDLARVVARQLDGLAT
jgi:acyl carrier protein